YVVVIGLGLGLAGCGGRSCKLDDSRTICTCAEGGAGALGTCSSGRLGSAADCCQLPDQSECSCYAKTCVMVTSTLCDCGLPVNELGTAHVAVCTAPSGGHCCRGSGGLTNRCACGLSACGPAETEVASCTVDDVDLCTSPSEHVS